MWKWDSPGVWPSLFWVKNGRRISRCGSSRASRTLSKSETRNEKINWHHKTESGNLYDSFGSGLTSETKWPAATGNAPRLWRSPAARAAWERPTSPSISARCWPRCGRRVIILDADLGLANADILCNIQLCYNLAHVVAWGTRWRMSSRPFRCVPCARQLEDDEAHQRQPVARARARFGPGAYG